MCFIFSKEYFSKFRTQKVVSESGLMKQRPALNIITFESDPFCGTGTGQGNDLTDGYISPNQLVSLSN